MKKLLAVVLALVLMIPVSGFAEKKYVYALTFCELYVQRLLEMAEALGIDMGSIGYEPFSSPFDSYNNPQLMEAQCSAGTLVICKDDLKVIEWSDILLFVDDDSNSFTKKITSCSASISALEYDVTEANILYLTKRTKPAMAVYLDILSDVFKDQNIFSRAFSEGNVLIYEGKYKYYLDGYIANDGTKMIFITAK